MSATNYSEAPTQVWERAPPSFSGMSESQRAQSLDNMAGQIAALTAAVTALQRRVGGIHDILDNILNGDRLLADQVDSHAGMLLERLRR